MTADVLRLRLLLVSLAGWINRQEQHLIDYLVEENPVLREQLKGQRLRLTDDQRRRLAAKGHRLGRPLLRRVATVVTPHDPAVASAAHCPEMDVPGAADRPPRDDEEARGAYCAHGDGKRNVGL